mgnify:CR=1 FL=1
MAVDPNHEYKAACKRRRELVLGSAASVFPDWITYRSHSSKINANLLFDDGLLERVRDTYHNCWRYRWRPNTNNSAS